MAFFNRKLYRNKPRQWGPPSAVLSNILNVAEQMGIDPTHVCMVMPMWGSGIQRNLISNVAASSQSGVLFTDNRIRLYGTGSIYMPSGFPTSQQFSVVFGSQDMLPVVQKYLLGWGGSVKNGGPHFGRRDTSRVRFASWGDGYIDCVDPVSWYDHNVITTLTKDTPGNGLGTIYYDGKYIDQGTINTSSLTSSAGYIGAINNGTYNFNGFVDFVYGFNCLLNSEQIAILSDNPYVFIHRQEPHVYVPPPPTVELSPAAGEYTSSTTIELSYPADPTATIYYTTDGSDPDNTDTEYTAAIPIGNFTLKAIAYVSGSPVSDIASAVYTVSAYDVTVSFDPVAGEYGSSQTITIESDDVSSPPATIYYTTDGSDPDPTDTEYTTPITIGDFTLKAVAYDETVSPAEQVSEIASATYTISDIPIYIGSTKIVKIYVGSTQITDLILGPT